MISKISRIGKIHTEKGIQNEDNLFVYETSSYILGAVFDGCSTGTNSSFASQLFSYAFENFCKTNKLLDFQVVNPNYKEIWYSEFLSQMRNDIVSVAKTLHLTSMNLLSTMVFFHYDKYTKTLTVRFFGDGVVLYEKDEEIFLLENDQANTPDYFAYHLNDENLLDYLSKCNELIIETEKFVISTDGIFGWQNKNENNVIEDYVKYLFNPLRETPDTDVFLQLKYNILTKNNKWSHGDDFTIIKYEN